MNSINNNIKSLSEEYRRRLNHAMCEALEDRDWCELHRINYSDPDMEKAKRILCNDGFELKYPFPKKSLKIS